MMITRRWLNEDSEALTDRSSRGKTNDEREDVTMRGTDASEADMSSVGLHVGCWTPHSAIVTRGISAYGSR